MKLFKPKNKVINIPSPLVRQSSWHRVSRDPSVDWVFIFMTFVACTAILIVVGFSTYISVEASLSKQPDPTIIHAKSPINVQELNDMVKYFDTRAEKYSAASKGIGVSGDPSL